MMLENSNSTWSTASMLFRLSSFDGSAYYERHVMRECVTSIMALEYLYLQFQKNDPCNIELLRNYPYISPASEHIPFPLWVSSVSEF